MRHPIKSLTFWHSLHHFVRPKAPLKWQWFIICWSINTIRVENKQIIYTKLLASLSILIFFTLNFIKKFNKKIIMRQGTNDNFKFVLNFHFISFTLKWKLKIHFVYNITCPLWNFTLFDSFLISAPISHSNLSHSLGHFSVAIGTG